MFINFTYVQIISTKIFIGKEMSRIIYHNDYYNHFYGIRNKILILNCQSSIFCFKRALNFIIYLVCKNRKFLITYTASEYVFLFKRFRTYIKPHIFVRYTRGGMLTNLKNVKKRLAKWKFIFPDCVIALNLITNMLAAEAVVLQIPIIACCDTTDVLNVITYPILMNINNIVGIILFMNLLLEAIYIGKCKYYLYIWKQVF